MRKAITTICFILISLINYAQDASYSFVGKLTHEQQVALLGLINELPTVNQVKIRYKEDSERGEILFYFEETVPETRGEHNASLFSPIDVKRLFSDFQLEGLEYHTYTR